MTGDESLSSLALTAARQALGDVKVAWVEVTSTLDTDGKEALHVLIVLAEDGSTKSNPNMGLAEVEKIKNIIEKSGENRFPIIEFTSEEELRADVDPES